MLEAVYACDKSDSSSGKEEDNFDLVYSPNSTKGIFFEHKVFQKSI